MGMTEPLVRAEVDLRDFAFMPLDVLRLRDSELACVEDAEVFRCAVLSWCVSWHQVPAASLPDDDVLLARLLGFGRDVRGWRRVREAGGMRGWVLCSDGRLYHPVVAEKARDAWDGKLAQRWRTEAARIKKHNQRHKLEGDSALQMLEFEAWKSAGCPQGHAIYVPGAVRQCPERLCGDVPEGVPGEKASKGEGEGQGQGQGEVVIPSEAKASGADAPIPGHPPAPPTSPGTDSPPDAPPTDRDLVFAIGVPLLTAAGVTDRNARSFLAAQSKSHGDAKVVDALNRCAKERPIQPVPWLQASLGLVKGAKHTGFASKDYRAGVEADGSFA